MLRRTLPTLIIAAGLLGHHACGGDSVVGSNESASGGASGAAAGGGTSSLEAGLADGNTYVGLGCINGNTQCTNCIDDDGDGLIDALDPECSGPLDDDEGSFATGIPGDNVDFCQDCFFDGNSGHGDDSCEYHTDCLYGEDPGGTAGCFNCEVSEACVDFCRPYTPNGCDCFGCCDVYLEGEIYTVLLSETCTMEALDDTELCTPCVQTTDCLNECGYCELCIGKDTIPEDCYVGGTGGASGTGGSSGQVCDDGQPVCNAETPCPSDQYYCLTGCCVPVVF